MKVWSLIKGVGFLGLAGLNLLILYLIFEVHVSSNLLLAERSAHAKCKKESDPDERCRTTLLELGPFGMAIV